MKYTKYPELKAELKRLAKEIKELKGNRKEDRVSKTGIPLYKVQSQISYLKYEFRHKHIAYCTLRGREYEQIERHCRVSPDLDYVQFFLNKYEQKTLCASA